MRRWVVLLLIVGLWGVSASGCGSWRDTPPTPIPITATPDVPVIPIPIVATETPSATPPPPSTGAAVSTPAPSRTPLPGPITDTPTFTPTYTNTPVTPGVPEDYSPVGGSDQSGPGIVVGAGGGACATVPAGTFGAIYQSDPNIPAAMGCPLAANASPMIAAYQRFENGEMIWIQSPTMIYVLYNNGSYQDFSDTFRDGVDPESSGRTDVPSGRLEPIRGFGKVWRTNPAVQQTLGWALAPEAGNEGAQVLLFERGTMIFLPQTNQTYILIASSGTWRAS